MDLMFKYDIYAEISGNKLIILELIPQKRKYIFSLNKSEITLAKKLVLLLNHGTNFSKLSSILSQSLKIKEIYEFIRDNHFLATYFGDEHFNNPFARQIEMLDSFNRTSSDAEKVQKSLFEKTALVIGAGGVGTSLCNNLNACGIGKIFVIDSDKVEPTNLSRQFLYDKDDIGKFKVDVLSKRLSNRGLGKVVGIKKMINLKNYRNIFQFLSGLDLVLGIPFPYSESVKELYKGILKLGIPIISIGEHEVGPLFTKSSQINVYRNFILKEFPATNLLNERREEPSLHDRHPSFLPEIQITSALATAEVIKYFTNIFKIDIEDAMFSLHSDNYSVSLVKLNE